MVLAIFYTDDVTNLERANVLSPGWQKDLKTTARRLPFKSASGQGLQTNGVVPLHVNKMRDNFVWVWFGVINGLIVRFFSRDLVHSSVRSVYPPDGVTNSPGTSQACHNYLHNKGQQTSRRGWSRDSGTDMKRPYRETCDTGRDCLIIRVARQMPVSKKSENAVFAIRDRAGVICVDWNPNLSRRWSVLVAREADGDLPHKRFHVHEPGSVERKMHLPKGMVLVQGSSTVAWLTTVNKRTEEETINAVPIYKSKTNKSEQVDQHLQGKRKDEKRLALDWTDEIQFNDI